MAVPKNKKWKYISVHPKSYIITLTSKTLALKTRVWIEIISGTTHNREFHLFKNLNILSLKQKAVALTIDFTMLINSMCQH